MACHENLFDQAGDRVVRLLWVLDEPLHPIDSRCRVEEINDHGDRRNKDPNRDPHCLELKPGTMKTSQNPNTIVATPAMLNRRRFVAPTLRKCRRGRTRLTAADRGHQCLDVDRTPHPDDDGNDVKEQDPSGARDSIAAAVRERLPGPISNRSASSILRPAAAGSSTSTTGIAPAAAFTSCCASLPEVGIEHHSRDRPATQNPFSVDWRESRERTVAVFDNAVCGPVHRATPHSRPRESNPVGRCAPWSVRVRRLPRGGQSSSRVRTAPRRR